MLNQQNGSVIITPSERIVQQNDFNGGTSMTAIIAMRNQNGMVFCSDSRSVKICYGGTPTKENRAVQKVFSNSRMIVAQHGTNTYLKECQEHYIEEILSELIDRKAITSVKDFCEAFRACLRVYSPTDVDPEYNLLFGIKEDSVYRFFHVAEIKKNNDYRITEMHGTYVFAGTIDLIPRGVVLPPDASVETMKEIGARIIRFSMELGDILVGEKHNPVGGKIQIATIT